MIERRINIVLYKTLIEYVIKSYENFSRSETSDVVSSIPIKNTYLINDKNELYISFLKNAHDKVVNRVDYIMKEFNNPGYVKKVIYKDSKKSELIELKFFFNKNLSNKGKLYLFSSSIGTKNSCTISQMLDFYKSKNPLNYDEAKLREGFEITEIKSNCAVKKLVLKKNTTQTKNGMWVHHIIFVNNNNKIAMISDPFSLICFRQLYKRKNGVKTFYYKQFLKFLEGKKNDLKYYNELIFESNTNTFKEMFNYKLNFYYYIDSQLPLSPPLTPESIEINCNSSIPQSKSHLITNENNNECPLLPQSTQYIPPNTPPYSPEMSLSLTESNSIETKSNDSQFEDNLVNHELINELFSNENDINNLVCNDYFNNLQQSLTNYDIDTCSDNLNNLQQSLNNYDTDACDDNLNNLHQSLNNYGTDACNDNLSNLQQSLNNNGTGINNVINCHYINDCYNRLKTALNSFNMESVDMFSTFNQQISKSNEVNYCDGINGNQVYINIKFLSDEELKEFINFYDQNK